MVTARIWTIVDVFDENLPQVTTVKIDTKGPFTSAVRPKPGNGTSGKGHVVSDLLRVLVTPKISVFFQVAFLCHLIENKTSTCFAFGKTGPLTFGGVIGCKTPL